MAKRSRANTAQPLEENGPLEPRSLPVQHRSRQTVERILETAAELVDEVGVVGFTTNLVAERAGIRIRTIYRYFPSKLGILSALMLHLNDDSAERLKQLSELGDPECDWRELVCRWFDDVVKWTRERPGARLLIGWSHNIPELTALEDEMDEEWAHSLMDAMRARGVDLPSNRLYAVCRTFNEMFDSMASLTGWDDQECSDEIVEEARRMLVRYLELYLD
jgi:AcrR family transcriptional regulator